MPRTSISRIRRSKVNRYRAPAGVGARLSLSISKCSAKRALKLLDAGRWRGPSIIRRNLMKTIKGPCIFLGLFAGDEATFNTWDGITKWAAEKGYAGVQVPTWASQLIDLKKASESKDYCDEFAGVARQNGVEVTELSTHLQGQLVAVHPAYDEAFDGFAVPEVRGNPKARQAWAVEQVRMAITASRNLGISAHATFSGALA